MAGRNILFAVKNYFYLGAYNNVLNEVSDMEGLTDAEQAERDALVYRSYIALGSHELVIKEVDDSSPMALQAVKLLAQYSSGKESKDSVLATISDWLSDLACNRNPTVVLVAGMIYSSEGMYVEALNCCHVGLSLEMLALCVQIYLKMDRVDKAEQTLKAMSQQDDDDVITQLANAWVDVQLGGAKVQEAQYIFQELGDKVTYTPLVYNGLAVCNMKMGQWEEAERNLMEAFNKDAKDSDTLANLITCGLHLGKSTGRYVTQLKVSSPSHPMVKRMELGETLFSRACASTA